MVAVLILTLSALALLKFGIWQWRLVWLTTASQPISDSLRMTTGLDADAIGANDFRRLMKLSGELSPGFKRSTPWLREIACYYRAITKLEQFCRWSLPPLSRWAANEMKNCSRFVAVVLDQRLCLALDSGSGLHALR